MKVNFFEQRHLFLVYSEVPYGYLRVWFIFIFIKIFINIPFPEDCIWCMLLKVGLSFLRKWNAVYLLYKKRSDDFILGEKYLFYLVPVYIWFPLLYFHWLDNLFLSNVSTNIAVVIYLSVYISMLLRIQDAPTIYHTIPKPTPIHVNIPS